MKTIMRTVLCCVLALAMCVSVFATASVSQSGGIFVVPSTDSSTVFSDTGEALSESDIIVTVQSNSDSLDTESLAELEEAYADILAVSDMSELASEVPSGISLTAAMLFNITCLGDAADVIANGGTVTVLLDVGVTYPTMVVLAYVDADRYVSASSEVVDLSEAIELAVSTKSVVSLTPVDDNEKTWVVLDSQVISDSVIGVTLIDDDCPILILVSSDDVVSITGPLQAAVADAVEGL